MKTHSFKSTDVSVVICAYTDERWNDIVEAVASVKAQSSPVGEVVLVIDHNDALLSKARGEFTEGVKIVVNRHKRGLSGARNSGIEASQGAIVAFLDDDAAAHPEWAGTMVDAYCEGNVLGVGGAVEPKWLTARPNWWPVEFDWVVGCSRTGLPTERRPIRNPIGANMSVRREAFAMAGGFSTDIGRVGKRPIGCEETEFFIRAHRHFPDFTVLYEPASKVSHKVPGDRASLRYFRARCFAEGLSKAVVAKMVGSDDALSDERSYTMKTLPLGVLRGLRDAVKGDVGGAGRAAAIVFGLLATTTGYARGRADRNADRSLSQTAAPVEA